MPATKAAQDQFINNAPGQRFNPDNAYGLQCKDLADAYCIALWGNWQNTIRPGNGKDVFNNSNPAFFTKILNNPNDQNLIPQRGDIIVYSASRAVPEGDVAVVESADIYGVTVVAQDGYLQVPAFRQRRPYVLPNGAVTIGWIRPKLEPPKSLATPGQINDVFLQYLERPADQNAVDHYTRYTIDFVRADLQGSQEYRDLQARKAQAALAAADAEKRRAAEAAEKQRIAEEQAAAERLKRQAEEQARAVEEAKKNQAKVESIPLPKVVPPIVVTGQVTQPTAEKPAKEPKPKTPLAQSPVVRFLFALWSAWLTTRKKKV